MVAKVTLDELKKHLFIVFGYEHYNPLGAIRSLGENGIKPIVFILKQDVRVASVSKYIGKLYRIKDYEEGYEILMREYRNEKEKPFVIPCDDVITELFDKKYDEMKDYFYVSNAGEAGRITHYMDKGVLCDLGLRHGLNVAKSWIVKRGEFPEDLIYPILTKPLTSYLDWKLDYHLCHNREELEEAYKNIKCDELMLQQYIYKVNECCLDGFVVNRGKEMFISMASSYTYILPDYYSMEMIFSKFENEELREKLQSMFAEVGYEGIYSLEFMIDQDGKYWFLEINFRNSGWSWASTKLGMNLLLLWAEGMLTNTTANAVTKDIPKGYTALAEMEDYIYRVHRLKMISTLDWIKGMFKADCLYQWDSKDLKPVFIYWICRIIRVIKKKLHIYKEH